MSSSASVRRLVFSGIQPTGTLHLGNYFGAVQRWARSCENTTPDQRHSQLFSVVDLHAITMPTDRDKLRKNIRDMVASLLSCGVDPERCVLFQQSHVRQHAELCWILGCYVTLPMLSRMGQYKEKSAKLKEVPLGLFTYPVLQSADILLYKATEVPVGEDNVQNVQMAQNLVRLFNNAHGDVFPKPQIQLVEDTLAARLKSLRNPEKKMSKSDPDWRSCVYVTDTASAVKEKFKKAVTDFTSEVTYNPVTRPGVSNLVTIHSCFTGQTELEVVESVKGMTTAQYKGHLADVVNEHLDPIRLRFDRLQKDPGYLESVLQAGAKEAEAMAEQTMVEVRRAVGLSS